MNRNQVIGSVVGGILVFVDTATAFGMERNCSRNCFPDQLRRLCLSWFTFRTGTTTISAIMLPSWAFPEEAEITTSPDSSY